MLALAVIERCVFRLILQTHNQAARNYIGQTFIGRFVQRRGGILGVAETCSTK
jgi:hypothetical protein